MYQLAHANGILLGRKFDLAIGIVKVGIVVDRYLCPVAQQRSVKSVFLHICVYKHWD